MARTVIGCGLWRALIDIHTLPRAASSQVANNPEAIAAWLSSLDPGALVVFQATSGCDGPLIAALAERTITFSPTNPFQAREFARAIGALAKTDRLNTQVLPQMGSVLDLSTTVPNSPTRSRLSDFLRRRRQLVDIRKAKKAWRHNAGQDQIVLQIEKMIGLLTRQIAELDRAIARLIEVDQTLSFHARLLSEVPGVGPTMLAILLSELPELGTLDRRRIASLAHLLPHARESGTWRGTRRIWAGRRKVREALYIAARTASRRVPSLIAMRDRMRQKGKAPKTIFISVAR